MKKRTSMIIMLMLVLGALSACGQSATQTSPSESTTPDISADTATALVETKAGSVQGYVSEGIYTYRGIPYAQATERFVPAEDVTHWEDVLDATAYGPISPQAGFDFAGQTDNSGGDSFNDAGGQPDGSVIAPVDNAENPAIDSADSPAMDNNCQNLNIWTPGIGDGGKRPVMVWLHGGGFSSGSGNETMSDGENLSRFGDVVVVSVNHRLNVMGFLDLSGYGEKYKYSANVGITDIVDALEWVRDNIGQFGGDPENVTVFGVSGGGAKVSALMTTPHAKGLFHKGIIQSGATETVGPVFTSAEASKKLTTRILAGLGITGENIEDLQTVDYEELTAQATVALQQTAEEFGIPGSFGGFAMEWEPVLDGDYMPTNPVTEDSFADAGRDIPLLIGTNLSEWEAFSLMMGNQDGNKTTWNEDEANARLKEKYGDKSDEIAAAFLEAYPYKTKADALYVDSMIRLPILKIMSHKADQGGAPVYAYMFTWESPALPGLILANHMAEIPFVFHNIDKSAATIGDSEEARALEERMSRAWVNFAGTGDPNTDNLPEWPSFDRESGATMLFDNEPMVGYHHDRKLLTLLAPEYQY